MSCLALLFGCEPGCPEVTRCDVRERGCQRDTMEAVACLRGGSGDHLPKVSVLSEAAFIARLTTVEPEDAQAQADAEAAYALWNRGLALFGLAPPGYDVDDAIGESAAETRAAFFPDQGDIVIIDRGESLADDEAVEVFAHEIVHALQDRELDLLSYGGDARSFDGDLALDGLIEGEAILYQLLVAAQLANRTADEVDWEGLFHSFRSDTLNDSDGDDAPVAMADLRFPYAFGGGFVTQHWLERGRAGVDALFEDPPRTTSEMLFGTSGEALEAERDALEPRAVPMLDDAFEEQTSTALGAWVARMYAARVGVPLDDRLQLARELGADSFSVHHHAGRDLVVAAWRARMLPGTAAEAWPLSPNPTTQSALDEDERESAQLAGDSGVSEELAALAWRAPAEDEPASDEAAASIGRVTTGRPFAKRARACVVRHVPMWWR